MDGKEIVAKLKMSTSRETLSTHTSLTLVAFSKVCHSFYMYILIPVCVIMMRNPPIHPILPYLRILP